MKHLIIFLVMLTTTLHAQEPYLLGKITVAQLQQSPYKKWFNNQHNNYATDKKTMAALQPLLDSTVHITIVMATWCGDSKEQVPRFYKVLNQSIYYTNEVTLICTDKNKTTPDGLLLDKNIIKVPTFIVYQHHKEIGRIIETPATTLENDLLQLLLLQRK